MFIPFLFVKSLSLMLKTDTSAEKEFILNRVKALKNRSN